MLAFPPLFVTATALLAACTSAAPLSRSPANPTKGMTSTLFRFTDLNTHRIPTAVVKDRTSILEEREFDPTTNRFPTWVVSNDRTPDLGEKNIDPTTTHRIPTWIGKDRAPNPKKKENVDQFLSDVSPPASANIQYHAAVKREVLGPFLHLPLIPSSFHVAAEKWYKKKKYNGQAKPDNSLNWQAMEGRKED